MKIKLQSTVTGLWYIHEAGFIEKCMVEASELDPEEVKVIKSGFNDEEFIVEYNDIQRSHLLCGCNRCVECLPDLARIAEMSIEELKAMVYSSNLPEVVMGVGIEPKESRYASN